MQTMNANALKCQGLVKRYEDVVALQGLDLEVRRGECFGLLGPNGAGKTTTVEILEGLTPADAGDIEILGGRWGAGKDHELRARIGIHLQDSQLGDKLTVKEVVRLFRSFYPSGRGPDEAIRLVDLEAKSEARYHKLSGGQKQRLALACALVGEPELLFLDEPTTGLDPQARLRIWEVVEAFCARGGTAILTTHYMEEAAHLCDRLAILDHGKVIALGSPEELVADLDADQIIELEVEKELDATALPSLPGVREVGENHGRHLLRVTDIRQAMAALLAELEHQGTPLKTLATRQPTLDDVFLHLTGRALRDE